MEWITSDNIAKQSGAGGSSSSSHWEDRPIMSAVAARCEDFAACAATTIVYIFSFAAGNTSVYDPYWVLAPLHLAFVWKAAAPGGFWFYEPRETICIVLLWVWALRFVIMVPWEGWTRGLTHEDWRYEQIREALARPGLYWLVSYCSLHLTPTLLVYLGLCPLGRIVLQGKYAPPLCYLETIQ